MYLTTRVIAADLGFAFPIVNNEYAIASLIDLGWPLGFLFATYAAARRWTHGEAEVHSADSSGRFDAVLRFAPYPVVLDVTALLFVSGIPGRTVDRNPFVLLALATVILVLVRQFFMLGENQRLNLELLLRLEFLAAAVFGMMAIALIVLATGASILILAGFIVLWGIGSGIGPALEPMLVSRLFGRKHYGLVYRAMDGVDTVLAMPGPWLGAVAFDVSGSYLSVILLYASACIAGSVSFGLLPRLLRRGSTTEVHRASASPPPVPARSSTVAVAAVAGRG